MKTRQIAWLATIGLVMAAGAAPAQQAPSENKGMKAEVLSELALGKQGLQDWDQREMRMRLITIEPGGAAAFHSHKTRPALTYILKGTLTEYRKGAAERTYHAGEVIAEGSDVDHWAENKTNEPVTLVSVDLFRE